MTTPPSDPYGTPPSGQDDDRPPAVPPSYPGANGQPADAGQREHAPGFPPAYPSESESAGGAPYGGYGEPPAAPAEPSKSITAAVKLMYVGAGLSLLWTLLLLPLRDTMIEELEGEDLGGSDPATVAGTTHTVLVVVGALTVGLWLWMAFANRKGQAWARIVATVLGGLAILVSLFNLLGAFLGIDAITILLNLALIGLAGSILWLLYRPDSSEYYKAGSNRPRY